MKIIQVAHPAQVPVKRWIWCLHATPEEAAFHVAQKFSTLPADTVYTFGHSVAVPLDIQPEQFWMALDNGVG